jgi:hypothetical protein
MTMDETAPLSDRNHFIDLAGGKFDSTSREDLDRLFANLDRDPDRNTLVLHFHGGLNKRERALTTAAHLLKVYRSAGAYPVFWTWQTDFLSVIEARLARIADEPVFRMLVAHVMRFAKTKVEDRERERGGDLAEKRGELDVPTRDAFELELQRELERLRAGAEPFAQLALDLVQQGERLRPPQREQFAQELENDPELQREFARLARGVGAEPVAAPTGDRGAATTVLPPPGEARETLMSPEVQQEIRESHEDGGEGDRGLVGFIPKPVLVRAVLALTNVVKRYALGRDHGAWVTAVEEVLRQFYLGPIVALWFGLMKGQIEPAFEDDETTRGGTAFLRTLAKRMEQGYRPRIVLVGHSAGSVYICKFLDAAQRLCPQAKFEIIFLSPAVTFRTLALALERHAGERIVEARNFIMTDEQEIADRIATGAGDTAGTRLVNTAYPRSLLYFTAGVMEEAPSEIDAEVGDVPVVGMARYFTGAEPFTADHVTRVVRFFKEKPGRLILSTPAPGTGTGLGAVEDPQAQPPAIVSHAITHGEFQRDAAMMASLRALVAGTA